MITVAVREDATSISSAPATPIRVALLGCGTVGGAFAALARGTVTPAPLRITHALVRDLARTRPTLHPDAARVSDGAEVLATRPDAVVELLGGIEPARSLVLAALLRGIPVITANKSLLAAHGPELREAAARTATPLLFEAAVIAGVPFLGTFARRPYAAGITSLAGIVNGTSNYILTSARDDRCAITTALAEAQRLGYAEPDPANDIDGIDAAEKLVVLLQLFAGTHLRTGALEVQGIGDIVREDIELATGLNGTIKPVVSADLSDGVDAFVGPAFVPRTHVLAGVDGVENAVVLNGPRGRLVLRGPGAGPEATAATVMDDLIEAVSGTATAVFPPLEETNPEVPATEWYITLSGTSLPSGADVSDLLGSYGVYLKRTAAAGPTAFGAITWPVTRGRIEDALRALMSGARCEARCLRALEEA